MKIIGIHKNLLNGRFIYFQMHLKLTFYFSLLPLSGKNNLETPQGDFVYLV